MRYRFLDFDLDVLRFELRRGPRRLALRPKAFDLLTCLVRERARVVPRAELVASVWGHTAVGPGSLSGLVNELRQVLGDDATDGRLIRTVHARGYQFVGVVTEDAPHAPHSPPERRLVRRGDFDRWLVRLADERGLVGFVDEALYAREIEATWSEASTAGLGVVRVAGSAIGDVPASRLGAALVSACVAARGRGAVAAAMPLPMRAWFEASARLSVAGGQMAAAHPPGGPSAWAGLVAALARKAPLMIVLEPFATSGEAMRDATAAFLDALVDVPVGVLVVEATGAADPFGGSTGETRAVAITPFRRALDETLSRHGIVATEEVQRCVDGLCRVARRDPDRPVRRAHSVSASAHRRKQSEGRSALRPRPRRGQA